MRSKDERKFRRYRKSREFPITFKDEVVKAKMLDYSPEGIGVLVNGASLISKGDIINLSVPDPEITTLGEVVWSYIDAEGLRMGIKNVGRLKGQLPDFRLADILLGLHRNKKTGILKIAQGEIVSRVYMRDGDVVFSASTRHELKLADLLLREGKITGEQYENALGEMKKTGLQQGVVLARLGYIKPKQMAAVVRQQVEEIILGLFNIGGGSFEFEEVALPPGKFRTLKLSPAGLIYQGVKRVEGNQYVACEIPDPNTIPCFSSDPADLFRDIHLDGPGSRIVSLIDGNRTFEEVIGSSLLERNEAVRTLYTFICSGFIDILTSPVSNGYAGARQENTGEETKERTENEDDRASADVIREMHARYASLGFYGVLGVKESSSPGEIKSAYYRAAKRFHPDVHFSMNDESVKSMLSDIFSFIYQAYATLSDPDKRRKYDEKRDHKVSGPLSSREQADGKFGEGKAALGRGDFQEAEQLFGQAIYLEGSVAVYHYYYGLSMMHQNRLNPAGKAIEKALSMDPLNADFNTELGYIFMQMGFPKRAKGLFEKALKESPSHRRAAEGLLKIQEAASG